MFFELTIEGKRALVSTTALDRLVLVPRTKHEHPKSVLVAATGIEMDRLI